METQKVVTVDTCSSCRHVFVYEEVGEIPQLFCTADSTLRPKCGSLALKEPFTDEEQKKRWDEWSKNRYRHTDNVCGWHEGGGA